MVRISFDGCSVAVPAGTTLLDAARLAGLVVDAPCNGAGICRKCLVRLELSSLGNVVQRGAHQASAAEASRGLVLACETEVTGDVSVLDISGSRGGTLQIVSHGVGPAVVIDPFISKRFDPERAVTRVFGGGEELAREPGNTSNALYGVVVDIGTTTLSASLLDLLTGAELACAGALNPQSHHAQDVLSRIRFAATDAGLATMQAEVIAAIALLIEALARQGSVDPQHIYEVVFSGNTCMLHLAVGESPASLGRYPYHVTLAGDLELPACRLKLPIAPGAQLYLPPVISAYVGADIASGILASALQEETETTLLIDIGTNGEMVLTSAGRLFATSTAAGPAFEGMNISCGMRASTGAIERFSIAADGTLEVGTIDGAEAAGICGSGLMDIVAQLVDTGVVAGNGRFAQPERIWPEQLRRRLETSGGKARFRITEKVTLSQKDVRQVQLAKGAIRAGIELLLREVGIEAKDVDRVLIAGSFGYHLRALSLISIGLLPAQFAGRIEFVGNTSKTGAEGFLLSRAARREMAELVKRVEVVELANLPDFDKYFVEALGFAGPGRTAGGNACSSV
jgi:uncharacterized 2Fe-2S/4Fe-4S cluster protein (DUF4445 family)